MRSKSLILAVANVRLCSVAVAAISASPSDILNCCLSCVAMFMVAGDGYSV